MPKDFYETLGVSRDASADDIKRAYRKLSKELHPDKHKGDKDIERQFQAVNEAYEVLSDPKKRQMYDQFGTVGGAGEVPGGGFGGFDFSGFANGEGAGFADIFESFFGGRGQGRGAKRDTQGAAIEIALQIDFNQVIHGGQQTVSIRRQQTCEDCSGSGAQPGSKEITCTECDGTGQVVRTAQSFFGTIQQSFVCPKCHGKGQVPETPCAKCGGDGRYEASKDVTIDIPAGIHDGQTLRVRGEGEAGVQGAPAGDLFVHISVTLDPRFVRDGDDIRSTQMVAALDAILGTEITVTTVTGDVTLKIPEGTQPNQVFRLRGKGLPVLGTSRHGDHFVTVNVEIPRKLSRAERKVLEEWKKVKS